MKNIWSTEDEYIDSCGKHDYNFQVLLSQNVKEKIEILMTEIPNLEWIAYMTGSIDYNRKYAIIDDLIIPYQEIGVSKIYNIGQVDYNTIGVIHSHHSMGNFFSNDDKETINKNNDIMRSLGDFDVNIDNQEKRVSLNNKISVIIQKVFDVINDNSIYTKKLILKEVRFYKNQNVKKDLHFMILINSPKKL